MNLTRTAQAPRPATQKVFTLLFLGAIGTILFFSAIPIYLRSLGLSTAQVALMVASTALPNMLLGSAFGRWVDKTSKSRLFLGLSVALALVETCLVFALAAVQPEHLFWAAAINLQLAALLFSPLSTLTYQYLIPSLDADETRAFARWELATGVASVCAAGASLAMLMSQPVRMVLIVDACTLLIAGVLIYRWWPAGTDAADDTADDPPALQHTGNDRRPVFALLIGDGVLLRTAFAMLAVAFSIHAFEANVALLSHDGLRLTDSTSIALAAILGAISSISAWLLQRHATAFSDRIARGQEWCLCAYIVIAAALGLAFRFDVPVLAIGTLMAIAVVEPAWSVATTRLIRSRTPSGRYGELHGLIRMPRALFTMAGATLVGYAHEAGSLWLFAAVGCILLVFIRLWPAWRRA